VVPGIASPFVCGLGQPLLLWPAALEDRLAPACQQAILVHELAHLRRRDHWVAWLRLLAGCAWWWDPLYWYVCRQLGRDAELACDAWVVGALPNARRAYAEALLAVAQLVSKTAAPAPAVGMSGSRQDFERRLTMVMCERVPCKVPVCGLVVIGLLALAVLPGWSLGQRTTQPPVPTTTPAQPAPQNQPAVAVEPVLKLTPANQVTSTVVLTQPPGGDERERKLKELEQKIQSLLKEVQALRGPKTSVQTPAPPHPVYAITQTAPLNLKKAEPVPMTATFRYTVVTPDESRQELALTRAVYKLPKDKADALAAFLPHIKAQVLESKVEGDGIVVTTTPDIQRTIGELVALLLGKSQHTANTNRNSWFQAEPLKP
jgi:hypothetical protein